MAIELAVAYVSVVPTVRGIQGELARGLSAPAAAEGTRAGDKAGRNFATSFNLHLGDIAKGAGLVSAASLAAGAAISGFGIKGAAALETTTTAFTSLLGSSKAATDQIAQLQQFAAKTPFSQQDVFSYAQQYFALANSIGLAKDNVQPFLQTIGDVAAVTGASTENIHNAVLAIGQMGSAGKVTLENLNQISEAFPGFNGAAAIAAATGQKTADVLKEISAGTVDAKTGVQALLVGMQKFQGAAGAMAKQSETLKGVWSTFTDTISIQLTKAFQPVIPVIKQTLTQFVPLITNTLSTLAPAISAFITNLAPILGPLTESFGSALTAVFNVLGPILTALAPLIPPLTTAFVDLVNAVAPLFQLLAQALATVGPPLLQLFSQILTAVTPVVQAIAAGLLPVIQQLVAQLGPVLPQLGQAFAQILAAVAPLAIVFAQALAPVLPVLAQALVEVANALVPVIQQLAGGFATFVQQIAPQLPELAQVFGDLALSVAQLLVSVAPLIGPLLKVQGFFSQGILKAVEAFAVGLQHIIGWVNDLIQRLTELLQLAGHDVTINGIGSLSPELQQAADAANNAAQAVLNIASAAAAATAASINLGSALGSAAGKAVAPAPAGLGLGIGKLKLAPAAPTKLPAFDASTLSGFFNQATGHQVNPLTTALNSIFDSARAAGKKLSSGLVASLRADNKELIRLTNERDRVSARLATAQQHLADLVAQRKQEVNTVRSAVTGTFNLGQIPKPAFGEPVTFSSILRQVTLAASNARAFGSALRKLAKEGLNHTLLQQLAEAGPSALPQARALLAATPKQIGQLNAQFKSLVSSGNSTGKFIGNELYKSGIDGARGLVKGLQSQQSHLNAAIRHMAREMVRELRSALDMHSPSRRLFNEAALAFKGYEQGIRSRQDAIAGAAKNIANASMPASQAAVWAGAGTGGGTGPTVHLTQQIHNPVPEPPSRTSPAALRRAAYAIGR